MCTSARRTRTAEIGSDRRARCAHARPAHQRQQTTEREQDRWGEVGVTGAPMGVSLQARTGTGPLIT
eukprot:173809-Alexandrium_andersonii.AAC.1